MGRELQNAPHTDDTVDFSWEESLEVLSNQRRRFVLHYLKQYRDPTDLNVLATQVASWETEQSTDDVTATERKRVQNALQQHHLPKMEERGFIEYEPDQREVRLTDDASQCEFVVDILPRRGITWAEYYLGMVGLAVIGLAGLFLGIAPFTGLSPFHWGTFVVTAFSISAAVHAYDARYRMRIGAREQPLEVDTP